MAENRVILLMFFRRHRILNPRIAQGEVGRAPRRAAGHLLSVGIGAGVGCFRLADASGLAVGCIISVASTMVMMRLLLDRGETFLRIRSRHDQLTSWKILPS